MTFAPPRLGRRPAHVKRLPVRPLGAALLGAAWLAFAGSAQAGYAIQPADGTTVAEASPVFLVYLDGGDSMAAVHVAASPAMSSSGEPVDGLGSCRPTTPFGEPNKFTCQVDSYAAGPAGGLKPGVYYWWMSSWRVDPDNPAGRAQVSGPFRFVVGQSPSATKSSSGRARSGAAAGTARSTRTFASAAMLPTSDRYDGDSVKSAKITSMVYATLKRMRVPRTLAVACWSSRDWSTVSASAKVAPEDGSTTTLGFNLGKQPRWLHLSPEVCRRIQELIDTRAPTGRRAAGISAALHEALHSLGLDNEAQTNCFAVQLVPVAAGVLGFGEATLRYLGTLGVRYTRERAPRGYWNRSLCRDGGRWDLDKSVPNLA